MLHVTDVRIQAGFVLWLRFNDGAEGIVDLAAELDGEIFAPLRNAAYFSLAHLDHELGTVAWPNGADFAPEFLHARLEQTVAGR